MFSADLRLSSKSNRSSHVRIRPYACKYQISIIGDLREALAARDRDIRALQERNNYQSAEIQRLENQVFRAN